MEKNGKENYVRRIRAVMANKSIFPIPKGELWLGTDLLKQAGYTDTLENHFHMVEQLEQDMICLPITDDITEKPMLGYRYFQCTDLKQAVRVSDRFVAAVVDGPFQEIVNRMGLMEVLMGWVRNQQKIIRAYEVEKVKVLDLISRCLAQGIHAIIITDDLAAEQGPLISPADIGKLCTGFYTQAVIDIHKANIYAFLHSCGKIIQLANLIETWNIDGLASVQHSANNLLDLRKAIGPHRVIMAGIDADLLGPDPSLAILSEFQRILTSFASTGGLILSSSCGLYEGAFLDRINKIYSLADHLAEHLFKYGA